MLAFNLGVFFRNLKGAEVVFSARNEHCAVEFTGGVLELEEHTDLTHHLVVTLAKGEVSCEIAFDDEEESEEDVEEAPVRVHLMQSVDGAVADLVQSQFKFEEITLKPLVEEPADGEEGAAADGEPGGPESEQR